MSEVSYQAHLFRIPLVYLLTDLQADDDMGLDNSKHGGAAYKSTTR